MNLLTTAPRNDFLLSKEVQGMAGNGVCWGKIKAGLQGVSSTVQALTTSLFKRNNSMATEILGASDAPAGYGKFKCAACGREGMAAPSARVRVYCNATCSNRFASEKGRAETVIRKQEKKQARQALKASTPAPHSKTCTKCGETKPVDQFSKDARVGYKAACKSCKNTEAVAYAGQNKDKKAANWVARKADPERHEYKLMQSKVARASARALVPGWDKRVALHDAHVIALGRSTLHDAHANLYMQLLRPSRPALHDAHVKELKGNVNIYAKWKYHNIPKRMLYTRIKRWMHKHLGDKLPSRVWSAKLGFTTEELRIHLERQFVKGMNWENKSAWEIDHILPVASFQIDSMDSPDFLACFGLHNLRPIWTMENRKKGAKIEYLL